MERYPLSCGDIGWRAVERIASLLPSVRTRKIPVIYSTGNPSLPSPWAGPARREEMRKSRNGNDIVQEIAPAAHDLIIRKLAPSIFFGTPLIGILLAHRIDTLFCCGGVTSGCVRASVVDAASYGLKVGVIEECTFDRSEICHKVNLFDMDSKYANVISVDEFERYLSCLNHKATGDGQSLKGGKEAL
jgi:nicotinamidase-related amidase